MQFDNKFSPRYRGKVNTLGEAYTMSPKDGDMVYDKTSNQKYIWIENRWQLYSENNLNIGMNQYELNKMIYNQLQPLSKEQIKEKIKENLIPYIEKTNNKYYLLLCKDYNYYTVFHYGTDENIYTVESITQGLEECLSIGKIYDICPDSQESAIECWIKIEEELYCMLFFAYDLGIIDILKE